MRHASVAVCLFLLATTLSAATFDLPSDRQLLDRADVVVVATVLDARSHQTVHRAIFTDYRLAVEDVLKGQIHESVVAVREEGGSVNGTLLVIPGSASYEPGSRVVAFLRQRPDGSYFTAYMGLGKYRFQRVGQQDVLVRDPDGIEITEGDAFDARLAEQFVEYVRAGAPVTSRPAVHAETVRDLKPISNANADAYVLVGGSPARPLRWPCTSAANCSFVFQLGGGAQPGVPDSVGGVDAALAAWSLNPNSFISLSRDGISGATSISTPDGQNTILLNASSSPGLGSCDSASSCGKVWANDEAPTHSWDGSNFYTVFEGDVQLGTTFMNQSTFNAFMVHELGHAIALRHSNQGVPATSASVMNSSLTGSQLFQYDLDALAEVYGTGAPCVPVAITTTSGGGSVPYGQSASLSVTATGDTPRQHQWYEGPSGTTTTPVGTNSPNFVTPAITETKQYWVKVGNSCPSSASSATITVTPQACDAPQITTQSQNAQITPGSTKQLQVTASGTAPLTFRWYRSNTVGDTSVQVGTQATFTTPPLNTTTSYWARVSNNCPGGQVDTALITITVANGCVPATITAQSSNISVLQGDGATISVTAAGTPPFNYQWYTGDSPDQTNPIFGATGHSFAAGPFNSPGNYKFWAKVTNGCPSSANSATIAITVACPQIVLPLVSAPAISHFSTGYNVSWTGNVSVTPTFELQEATNPEFTANLQTFTVSGALSRAIAPHLEIAVDTRFYYRVRAFSVCTGQPTAYSNTASTVITRPLPENSSQFAISIPEGTTQSFTQNLLVPGFGETATANDTFSITTDVPWLTVFPATGALSAGGTTVQLTVNPPGLEVGTTTGSVQLTRTNGTAANGVGTHNGPIISSLPFSVSLVTPVSPDPRDGNPPPGTLIIPAVAHAQGVGSPFRSDVRIVNVSFADIDYEISYTPSQTDGTQTGKKTNITVHAGDVLALDDIVASWYGAGMLGEGGIGTIEIRPLTSNNPLDTFASSRTYALDKGGTLGQFIPALRVNAFIGNFAQDSLARISLQQIANNAEYRTNVGFVEGTGTPVSLIARLVDGNNNLIQQVPLELSAFGHLQRPLTNLFNNVQLNDGRVEVEVTSPGGKVSAYASVLNNLTNDPLMVFPVQPARTTAERYVLAGIAEFVAASNFHSDMRLYNAGPTTVTATLNYYEQGSSTPHPGAQPVNVTLNPGQVRAIDDVLPSLWPGLVGGGSVIATTSGPSSLVLTAQTFSRQADGGTKGQFIPGVTFREAVGLGDRALEVLQLEQSDQYRSNVGFVEVTGKPVKIEVTGHKPDAKISTVTTIDLKANEYVQYARILSSLNLGTVYNGRISVKVIEGEGRVYAYGSTVDNRTEDPTYVPAQ